MGIPAVPSPGSAKRGTNLWLPAKGMTMTPTSTVMTAPNVGGNPPQPRVNMGVDSQSATFTLGALGAGVSATVSATVTFINIQPFTPASNDIAMFLVSLVHFTNLPAHCLVAQWKITPLATQARLGPAVSPGQQPTTITRQPGLAPGVAYQSFAAEVEATFTGIGAGSGAGTPSVTLNAHIVNQIG